MILFLVFLAAILGVAAVLVRRMKFVGEIASDTLCAAAGFVLLTLAALCASIHGAVALLPLLVGLVMITLALRGLASWLTADWKLDAASSA
jgi:hypothetical protein